MVTLTFPNGLTADKMDGCEKRVSYTSVTNIGAYMWSTVVARELGLIKNQEVVDRLGQTLRTLETMYRFKGQFNNWYNIETRRPSDDLFLSSVDNGWLATGLLIIKNGVPELQDQAAKLLDQMNFGMYYNDKNGCLYRGYYPNGGNSSCDNFTCGCYGTLNTEPRIASYIGISKRQLPQTHYFRLTRTEPDECSASWAEMEPKGTTRKYMGVTVYEGHFEYRGFKVLPSWGGSMFEALMPALFVPEVEWGSQNWGINHGVYVKAQIDHGLNEAGYGYWGFSPSVNPSGGYREYGVDSLGTNPTGYYSNNDNTGVDYGFPKCGRAAKTSPPPSAYTNGVVAPYAAFLALSFEPSKSLTNLRKMKRNFNIYKNRYGFFDAVNVQTKNVAKKFLSLDQGMIMAAIGNALANNVLQKLFSSEPGMEKYVKPLLEMEKFSV